MDTQFIETYRELRRDEMLDEIQRHSDSNEREAMLTTIQLHESILDTCRIIYLSTDAQSMVRAKMLNTSQLDKRIVEPQPERSTWLQLERPLEIQSVPFKIKTMFFTCSGDKYAIEHARKSIPQHWQHYLDAVDLPHGQRWLIDIISADNDIVFTLLYWAGKPNPWQPSIDGYICPWSICDGQPECKDCHRLRTYLTVYLCVGLAVANGEFAETRTIERSETRERDIYTGTRKNEAQFRVENKEQRFQIVYTDASERVKYIDTDAAPQQENTQQRDPETAEQEHRQNWLAMHQADEIEEIQKSASGHERHYKDGRIVQVAKSKERAYRKLKPEAKRKVERIAARNYKEGQS